MSTAALNAFSGSRDFFLPFDFFRGIEASFEKSDQGMAAVRAVEQSGGYECLAGGGLELKHVAPVSLQQGYLPCREAGGKNKLVQAVAFNPLIQEAKNSLLEAFPVLLQVYRTAGRGQGP